MNDSPDQSAKRSAINFFDWTKKEAEQYHNCYELVSRRVRPIRAKLPDSKRRERDRWWQYERRAVDLYSAIFGMQRVMVLANTSKLVLPAFVPTVQVFSHALSVFAYDDDFHFGLLSSAFHWWWAVTRASTMRTDIRYTPTDCFETFPQPSYSAAVEAAGRALDEHRRPLMLASDEGLTKTYNRLHNPAVQIDAIRRLRELHRDLDLAVAAAYGWAALDLDHGFHETRQGLRYTIGPAARAEVLDRLLELNHQRYAEEVAAGLHAPKAKAGAKRGGARKGRQAAGMRDLFGGEAGEGLR